MSSLALDDVSVRLGGRRILHGLSTTFRAGEVTAIVGPNGAGKSTLLSVLAGLRKPTEGQAGIDDQPLAALSDRERARRIGFLPQNAEIAWPLEVRALVALGLTPFLGRGAPAASQTTAVETAMTSVGVETLATRRVDTLSGGERARVLLARALVGDPAWLLADEPFAGLDPAHVLEVCAIFRRRAGEGHGVVLTLHDLTTAWRLADRVVVLGGGAILADGAPADALTEGTLAAAYGVRAGLVSGPGGGMIDVIGPA